jgi:hypothetical protein
MSVKITVILVGGTACAIALNASIPITTDKAVFALPETCNSNYGLIITY